jgi:hypothetical protein
MPEEIPPAAVSGQFWSQGWLTEWAVPSECRLDLIQTKFKMTKKDGGPLCDSRLRQREGF